MGRGRNVSKSVVARDYGVSRFNVQSLVRRRKATFNRATPQNGVFPFNRHSPLADGRGSRAYFTYEIGTTAGLGSMGSDWYCARMPSM
jgi:hypothetical protein